MESGTTLQDGRPEAISKISQSRLELARAIDEIDVIIAYIATLEAKPDIAEATLAKRAAQQSRHWLGETLAFYPTGYRVTDNPKWKQR